MNTVLAEQLAILQRMAQFAAGLRVYFPAFQPEMEGPVPEQPCAPQEFLALAA